MPNYRPEDFEVEDVDVDVPDATLENQWGVSLEKYTKKKKEGKDQQPDEGGTRSEAASNMLKQMGVL